MKSDLGLTPDHPGYARINNFIETHGTVGNADIRTQAKAMMVEEENRAKWAAQRAEAEAAERERNALAAQQEAESQRIAKEYRAAQYAQQDAKAKADRDAYEAWQKQAAADDAAIKKHRGLEKYRQRFDRANGTETSDLYSGRNRRPGRVTIGEEYK